MSDQQKQSSKRKEMRARRIGEWCHKCACMHGGKGAKFWREKWRVCRRLWRQWTNSQTIESENLKKNKTEMRPTKVQPEWWHAVMELKFKELLFEINYYNGNQFNKRLIKRWIRSVWKKPLFTGPFEVNLIFENYLKLIFFGRFSCHALRCVRQTCVVCSAEVGSRWLHKDICTHGVNWMKLFELVCLRFVCLKKFFSLKSLSKMCA